MEKEDRELLIKDLCTRVPYRTRVCLYGKETCTLTGIDGDEVYLNIDTDSFYVGSVKPYLRPMSSMTEEERTFYDDNIGLYCLDAYLFVDWLNAHYFDYRGLIEKGLALEAPKGMYNY